MKLLSQNIAALLLIASIAGCGGSDSANNAKPIYDKPTVAQQVLLPGGLMGGTIQNAPLPDLSAKPVTILAGGAKTPGTTQTADFKNYTGLKAQFNHPISITTDGTAIYVADFNNHAIRKISLPDLKVETIAGSGVPGPLDTNGTAAQFNYPTAITMDSENLYVADSFNYKIRKITLAAPHTVTTIAGSGIAGSIDSPDGATARFNKLNGITTDGVNIFVSDSNNTIRWIVKNTEPGATTYKVSTLAGTPGKVGSTDGIAGQARFNLPGQLTTDGTYLYVTDFNNRIVRKIDIVTADVKTIAGTKGVIGASDIAPGTFYQPNGITTNGAHLYVTDSYRNTIRRMTKNGADLTTLAGDGTNGTAGLTTDAAGAAARFDTPIGLTTDGIALYVADSRNNIIRQIK